MTEIEIWKFLPIESISAFFQVNFQLARLTEEDYFWKFLLERDFMIIQEGKVKQLYRDYYRILTVFGSYFDIVTQSAMQLIHKFLPEVYWDSLIGYTLLPDCGTDLLDKTAVLIIMEKLESLCKQTELTVEETKIEKFTNVRQIRQTSDIELSSDIARQASLRLTDIEAQRIAEEINDDAKEHSFKYSWSENIVYIAREPKIVDVDIDIIQEVLPYIDDFIYPMMVEQFIENLVNRWLS
ncbi:MAG: hypothetical protein H0U27_13670 [Nitrosopumilus sp.]|nr:hypothetical protein [Nitrosopumilus sp.]